MITSIIIDDEKHCIQSLETDLANCCPQVSILSECLSAKEGIMAIKKFHPQLVFLDVEMPWMNGFEMLEVLDNISFAIIFTTAYDRFAAKAFRISAVDYLLKPIAANDLKEAVVKAEQKLQAGQSQQNIENLLQNFKQPVQQQKIAFPQREGYEFIPVANILYCHAEGAYSNLHLSNGKKFMVSKTLGDVEEMLPADIFQRIHHSTIVNLQCVTNFIRSDGGYVMINNGEKLMISKAKKDMLLKRLGLKKDYQKAWLVNKPRLCSADPEKFVGIFLPLLFFL